MNGCDTPGCVSKVVTYKGASMDQVNALVNISLACEQDIRYNCYDSKLLKDGKFVNGISFHSHYWPMHDKCNSFRCINEFIFKIKFQSSYA